MRAEGRKQKAEMSHVALSRCSFHPSSFCLLISKQRMIKAEGRKQKAEMSYVALSRRSFHPSAFCLLISKHGH
jgi:hypothetical protein